MLYIRQQLRLLACRLSASEREVSIFTIMHSMTISSVEVYSISKLRIEESKYSQARIVAPNV